ncbi:MAG: hypothetical protein AAGD14_01335 [Planctomycetota bacterium]
MTGTYSVVVGALVTALVLGLVIGLAAARVRVVRRAARSRRQGRRGEARAIRLLRRAGYRVVATQPTAKASVRVDDRLEEYALRGDFLVRRRRRLYLAEIKGGAESAGVHHRATRRQLLEYACAFEVDGLLLVDTENGAVHTISFPALRV